ncbi:hypothetical protein CN177_16710 [Sinorhizobium meliloti]|uniref:hypothetical protein n=2 Tax=Rhizobium meliloti TaxID=382 RepID=UPI000FD75F96|nr:hypothetical protein [Sinorhizobium meliloti]RVG83261.1 hypothetical protein CN219_18315 [Sinorhizobium meliloti]RVI38065.1 hypothetical protein CN197_06530 [Sinorhizobium meliloti]RVI49473.1 hypothetical protein CN196_00835 [Sinorhizobium meliloti]RVJ24106.1 hypothetical protein CN177_16710 [Sinorhizobium meliloti]RVK03292.1 hypothetical protein CN170_04815 [Sinorhizobium meliloti]
MADEDMNGNGNSSFDPMANWARLSERVENQGKDIIDLRSNMNTGFQGVNANLAALSNELRSNSKTQWPAIWAALSVGVAILTGLGFMALQPIKDNTVRLEGSIVRLAETSQAAVTKISENMVTQKEMEWRSARGAEDRLRQEASLKDLRDAQVPRAELDRVWQGYDQRFADHQRQIDEVKLAQGSVYSQRDIILDLKENQQRLEREIARLAATNGSSGER